MPLYMIMPRYSHNYAQFCQLLNSNLFTHRRILMLLREATSETYGPRVSFSSYQSPSLYYCFAFTLLLLFTLHLYTKNTKNIISIRSHSRKWPRRDWQPLIALVASSYRFVQVRGTWAWPPTGLIPWFSKTKGNTYTTLLHHPLLFGEIQRSAQEVARRISGAVAGESTQKVNIPSTHHNPYLPHYILCHLPLVFLSPLHPCCFIRPLSLYPPSLSLFASFARFLFVCSCVGLLVCRDGSR